MVKKLFKHEILAYLRLWLPTQAVLLAVALFTRILIFFENDGVAYSITFGSSIFLYVVAIIASIGITFVFSIVRFYKNLFTHEGYLSFTLPVSPFEHIFVKVGTSVLFSLMTLVAIVVSGMIVTSGEMLIELFKAIAFMVNNLFRFVNGVHLMLYTFELCIFTIITLVGMYLFYYTCISIGQMAKKNRVLAAFGTYFGFYIVSQILSTIVIILIATFPDMFNSLMEDISIFADAHPYAFGHILFVTMNVISAAFTTLYFFITHLVIRKKLNLE